MNRIRRLSLTILVLLTTVLSSILLPGSVGAIEITCDPATPASGGSSGDAADATPEAVAGIAFPEGTESLTVFAAASLVDAFAQVETDLEAANPGLDITVETAGSQALVTQLTEGAEADVLATASNSSMTAAVDGGVVTADPETFIGNRLVIVTPPDNPDGIESFDDLANDDVLLVIAGEDVPAGQYARRAVCATGDDAFIGAVGDNVVSEEEDVRAVLAKIQVGEADAGIVYASDAVAANLADAGLQVIELPEEVAATVTYPIAPVEGGDTAAAEAFIAYVLGPDGQQTLVDFGFTAIP